jgi:hypothetical protein
MQADTPFNPFMLMMEPEAVLRTVETSKDLRRLRHHKYRPLDRPWIPFATTKKTVEALIKSADDETGLTH